MTMLHAVLELSEYTLVTSEGDAVAQVRYAKENEPGRRWVTRMVSKPHTTAIHPTKEASHRWAEEEWQWRSEAVGVSKGGCFIHEKDGLYVAGVTSDRNIYDSLEAARSAGRSVARIRKMTNGWWKLKVYGVTDGYFGSYSWQDAVAKAAEMLDEHDG